MSRPIYVRAGDTFFTHSSSMLGRLIRWGETDPDEKGTNGAWANHTGVIVEDGWIGDPGFPGYTEAVVIEALWKTRRGPWEGYKDGTEIRVFRPVPEYDDAELKRFLDTAELFVGKTYGWWKLAFQLADRALFKGKKVLTRLLFIDKRPICSYIAAKVNDAARRKNGWPGFGMPPQAADPDEMLDFCEANPEYWQEVV